MKVRALDHVNIRTDRLDETVAFYTGLLGMSYRPPPGLTDPTRGAWLCDDEGRPVLHVGTFKSRYPSDDVLPPAQDAARGGGAIHHVALECSGYDEVVGRLEAASLKLAFGNIPSMQLRQVFVEDPNGVTLELNFRGEAAA